MANNPKIGLVGGGQMGRALVGGMIQAGVVSQSDVLLVEPDASSQAWWRDNHRDVRIEELATVASEADLVLLAVKPNVIPKVAEQPTGFWSKNLVVSIAAGISLEQLTGWVGHNRIVRVMPNTPSLVGAGASAYCGAADVTDADLELVQAVLSSVGLAVEVAESQMDAVTGLSGSGPAYVCLMIEALADGGVLTGLPRPLAMRLAAQTVMGTAKMVAETGRHPGELKDAVASPGGTTIAALKVLEQNGLRAALIQAVEASAHRSAQMGNS